MTISRTTLIGLAALIACAASAPAQSPAPGGPGAPRQGFSVESLISELSLFLPEDAIQGMRGGFGAPGAPPAAPTGQAQGAEAPARAPGGQPPKIDFTRDAKLYLTKDQIKSLLPLFLDLKDNPLPTPSGAKQLQAEVDTILTSAQKDEHARFQEAMKKRMEAMQKEMSATGKGTADAAGPPGNGGQPPGGPEGAAPGGQAGAGRSPATVYEMRQKEVETFIKALRDRLGQINA